MKGFRVAREASTTAHVATTALQIVGFWSLFLFVLPHFVHSWARELGEPSMALPFHRELGVALFALASCLGLCSAWTMSTRGQGTPLPLATARRFVASGPYRWLRNPMALAGIAQGVAVGVFRDSASVVAYALAGAFAWHAIARPPEERDLLARFGAEYERYRASVPLWSVRMPRVAAVGATVLLAASGAWLLVDAASDSVRLARGPFSLALLGVAYSTFVVRGDA